MDPNYRNQNQRPVGHSQPPAQWQQNAPQQPPQWQQPQQPQQPPYTPPQYYVPPQPQPPYQPPEQTGFSIAGLVMGILGILSSCFCIGWIFGILGLVFAIVGKNKAPSQQGLNIAGLVLSIIALAIGLFFLFIGFFSEYDPYYYYMALPFFNLF